jgi:acetyl esterase/lipase
MKKIALLSIAWLLTGLVTQAQLIYPIKADSVRIYNTKDTAELILENHTQKVKGFLYNKGRGRTEFRQLQFSTVGDSALALSDQDSLSLKDMLWSGGLTQGLAIAPDANYSIPQSIGILLLRNITTGRTLTLPSPSANRNREIAILDKTTGNFRWTVSGAFVTRAAIGTPPYTAQNNVVINKGEKLTLFSDGVKWYDLSVCAPGTNQAPEVTAGRDTILPAATPQFPLNGSVTAGSSNTYTTIWRILSQPSGSNAVITDTTKLNTTVTGLKGGEYLFTIRVTDHLGLTDLDTIKVTVIPQSQMFSSGGYNDNVYDSATGRKLWIYLPDGYDPQRAEKYPLIIYLHGDGENGTDINLLLQPTAGLPRLIYDRAFLMESIVIFPQNTSGWWTTGVIKKAYNWAVNNYHVDLERVYTTGLSAGGRGASMMALHYPQLIAGYITAGSVESDVQTQGPTVKDIPAYFLNDFTDPYVSEKWAFDCINSINSANPKGIYPPLIRMTRFGEHGVSLWNNNIYDKRYAPFDFEQDFFLMHSKNPLYAAGKYVTKAETSSDYVDHAKAARLVEKLPAGADRTALQQRLNNRLQALTESYRYFIIDPGVTANAELPNTNKVTSATAGTIKTGLKDISGAASPINFEVTASADAVMMDDGMDHDYMGLQRSMYKDGVNITGTGSTFVLHNLTATASYDILIFHSRRLRENGPVTNFKASANGVSINSDENGWNTTTYLNVASVVPDGNNKITLQLTPSNDTATVNVIMLREKPGLQPGTKAKFNFCFTPANLPGWTDVYGDASSNVQEFTDPGTGWLLSTRSTANWQKYFEFFASDTNGVSIGTYGEFPPDVMRSFMYTWNQKFDGSNYNLEIKRPNNQGLPAGRYRIKVMASCRSEVIVVNRGELNAKFGNGGNQLQYMYPNDNHGEEVIFSGYVEEGGSIKLGVHSYRNWSDFGIINGLIVEKID